MEAEGPLELGDFGGTIPDLKRGVGFGPVREVSHTGTLFGRITPYEAR